MRVNTNRTDVHIPLMYTNKNVDIQFSAHGTFVWTNLQQMLKVKKIGNPKNCTMCTIVK